MQVEREKSEGQTAGIRRLVRDVGRWETDR